MEEMVSCSQPRKELEMRLQQGGTHVWEGELLDWKVEQEQHQNENRWKVACSDYPSKRINHRLVCSRVHMPHDVEDCSEDKDILDEIEV